MWKATGRQPPQLAEAPQCPEELIYIWDWYKEIFTGDTLTFTEMQSWSQTMGIKLLSIEAEIIRRLDRIFWSVQNDRRSKS